MTVGHWKLCHVSASSNSASSYYNAPVCLFAFPAINDYKVFTHAKHSAEPSMYSIYCWTIAIPQLTKLPQLSCYWHDRGSNYNKTTCSIQPVLLWQPSLKLCVDFWNCVSWQNYFPQKSVRIHACVITLVWLSKKICTHTCMCNHISMVKYPFMHALQYYWFQEPTLLLLYKFYLQVHKNTIIQHLL